MPGGKDPGPSIKDKEQYEALRDQGESKEKAARIANSDRQETGKKGGRAGSYDYDVGLFDHGGCLLRCDRRPGRTRRLGKV